MINCGAKDCHICFPVEPLERRMPAGNDFISPPAEWGIDHSRQGLEKALERVARESREYRANAITNRRKLDMDYRRNHTLPEDFS